MRAQPSVAVLATADLGLAFLAQAVVVVTVGFGAQTDAYFAAQVVPLSFYGILQLALHRAVVAVYSVRGASGYAAGFLVAAVLGGALLVMMLIAATAPWWFGALFREVAATQLELAIAVIRVQGMTTALLLANIVLMALNQVRGKPVTVELVTITATAISAAFAILTVRRLGVLAAAYASLLKATLAMVLSSAVLARHVQRGPVPWAELWRVVRPLASGSALTKLAPVVDRAIAAAGAAGVLSILSFAQLIYTAAMGLAERAVVAPNLPSIRRGVSHDALLGVSVRLAGFGLLLALAIIAAALVARSVPFVSEQVGADHLWTLAGYLAALSGFAIGGLIGQWSAAALAVLGRASLVARVAVVGFLASIPLKLVAFYAAGVLGLALAISGYYLANAVVLSLFLRRAQMARVDVCS
jgi:peptidoglycan biosynthesis protein MviN/MurJ (putative lipid II flippase)